jgi:hypothetical protein
VFDATESISEWVRSVAGSVVGQHFSYSNTAHLPNQRWRAPRMRRVLTFIGQQFGVGQTRVTVNRCVQEVLPAHRIAVGIGDSGGMGLTIVASDRTPTHPPATSAIVRPSKSRSPMQLDQDQKPPEERGTSVRCVGLVLGR